MERLPLKVLSCAVLPKKVMKPASVTGVMVVDVVVEDVFLLLKKEAKAGKLHHVQTKRCHGTRHQLSSTEIKLRNIKHISCKEQNSIHHERKQKEHYCYYVNPKRAMPLCIKTATT